MSKGGNGSHSPGAHSLEEILSQPQCWTGSLEDLRQKETLQAVAKRFAHATEWLFIGCGSSYYVAMSAAATMARLTGLSARALPASEVLLYPDVVPSGNNCVPVLISRSGLTSEVLAAGEALKGRGIPTLAISCATGQPLEKLASETILLPRADEKSTVMTRSFSSMLFTLQALAGVIAGNNSFIDSLAGMSRGVEAILPTLPDKIRSFVSAHDFDDYVYLGQGPFYGLACEGALKVTEMSVSYAQSFHTLEFRHGPKSIVNPETLLVFLLSESGYDAECEALKEMKSLGATTIAVTNRTNNVVRAASDLVIDFQLDVPEFARVVPYLFVGQLLGLHTGLKKGLDPDSPRNLSRVVVLDKETKPEHASI
ncbi:MAG TPA: SIS domain-containing protein [Terriglobales bacterium]|nr:SIS domain-containing protein [Terriglobales bacterium]